MKSLLNHLFKNNFLSLILVILLGTVSHFVYEYSGRSPVCALFFPVNESIWEHLKLLFFPFLLITIFQYKKNNSDLASFFYYRFLGVLSGMAATLILFYTYTGIIGKHLLVADILIFIFSVIFSFFMSIYVQKKQLPYPTKAVVIFLWILLSVCFFIFTFYPPNIALFLSA